MDLITLVMACSLYSDNSITNAMIQVGSQNKPYMISAEGGAPKTFSNQEQAIQYAQSQLNQGHEIDSGLMQIPSHWINHLNSIALHEMFSPCKNIVLGTQVLNHAMDECTRMQAQDPSIDVQSCALSLYKSGDPHAGEDYAHAVLEYSAAHPFDALLTAAKTKNPKEFPLSSLDHAKR